MAQKKGETGKIHYLKEIARKRGMTATAMYRLVADKLFDLNGKLIREEGFRSRYNRGNEPRWLVELVERLLDDAQGTGRSLVSTGFGKLKIVGGIGAGGSPSNYMDEDELHVPIEFSNPDWRGFVVESDARSMMPYIQPGDTVVIKLDRIPRLRKFMVIQDDRDPSKLYVKKVDHKEDRTVFVSTNPETPPVDMKGLSLIGLVIGVISADMSLKLGPAESGVSAEYFREQLGGRLP